MHELGLAEGIMIIAMDVAGPRPVNRIVVRIGEEQRIVPDSLEFGFHLLAEGTVCEGASLRCLVVPRIEVLVDEVELGGDGPTIFRPPGAPVVEPPHCREHAGHNGAGPVPVTSAHTPGGP